MTTTTTTTTSDRAILLALLALVTVGRGLAWLVVAGLVLLRVDWLLPRKAPASMESMESMESMAREAIASLRDAADAADADLAAAATELSAALAAHAPVEPMVHPWALAHMEMAQFSLKELRSVARLHGIKGCSKATRPQLLADLFAIT